MTKIELEKISAPDKYMFFEQGMRGGVSFINKRYSKANNEYCKDYDKKNLKIILSTLTWIIYMDCYADFKWVKNIDKIEQKIIQINWIYIQLDIYLKQI